MDPLFKEGHGALEIKAEFTIVFFFFSFKMTENLTGLRLLGKAVCFFTNYFATSERTEHPSRVI